MYRREERRNHLVAVFIISYYKILLLNIMKMHTSKKMCLSFGGSCWFEVWLVGWLVRSLEMFAQQLNAAFPFALFRSAFFTLLCFSVSPSTDAFPLRTSPLAQRRSSARRNATSESTMERSQCNDSRAQREQTKWNDACYTREKYKNGVVACGCLCETLQQSILK